MSHRLQWEWNVRHLRDKIEHDTAELIDEYHDGEFESANMNWFLHDLDAVIRQHKLEPTGMYEDEDGDTESYREPEGIEALNLRYKAAEAEFDRVGQEVRDAHKPLIAKAIKTGDEKTIRNAIMACPDQVGRAFGFMAAGIISKPDSNKD
jgi:hypothetical protein